jgi:hypothetical protein
VFDDDDRIAFVDTAVDHAQQLADIVEMQPGGGRYRTMPDNRLTITRAAASATELAWASGSMIVSLNVFISHLTDSTSRNPRSQPHPQAAEHRHQLLDGG